MSAGQLSLLIYTTISLLLAGTFFVVTLTTGDYTWVARGAGAGWVFMLSMIVFMPTVTPWIKKRLG